MYCGSGELCTLVLRTQSYGDEWLEVLRSAKPLFSGRVKFVLLALRSLRARSITMSGWKCSSLQNPVVHILFVAGHLSMKSVMPLRSQCKAMGGWKHSGLQKLVAHLLCFVCRVKFLLMSEDPFLLVMSGSSAPVCKACTCCVL